VPMNVEEGSRRISVSWSVTVLIAILYCGSDDVVPRVVALALLVFDEKDVLPRVVFG